MMKKLVLGLAVLIVIMGAGSYYLFSNLDSYIKGAVEKYGSLATQSKVTLDGVNLELTSGKGGLSGFAVENPKGFSSAKALYLGSIGVTLDTNTVRGAGPIVIKQIIIDKPQVVYELLNNGDSNLSTIQKNTQTFASSLQGKASSSGQATPREVVKDNAPPRKLIISDLVIRNGQIAISQEMMQGKQISTPLPEIHLTNIGKESGGATAGQVAEQVLGSITSAASQSALSTLAKEKLNGVLDQVPAGSIGKGAIDHVGTQLKGVFGQ